MENNIEGVEFEEVPKVELPKKMSYFNVKEALYALFSELEENCGELTDDLDARMKALDIKLEDKMHSIFFIKKEKEQDILMLKDEITRLGTKIKSIDNVIKKVKEIGLDATLEFGKNGKSGNKTLKYPDLSMWTVNRESLVVPEDLSETIRYGLQILQDTVRELEMNSSTEDDNKDGEVFKYSISYSNLTIQEASAIILLLEDDSRLATNASVAIMNTHPDIGVAINTDVIKKRIKYNEQILTEPDLFKKETEEGLEGTDAITTDDDRLKEVFDYKLVIKPSITFK